MRTPIAALLVVALAAGPLAGCGKPVPTGPTVRQGTQWAGKSATATTLAEQFADAMKPLFTGTVTVEGAVVALRYEDMSATTYDFTNAPKTGLVVITSEEFSAEYPLKDLMRLPGRDVYTTEALPVLLAPIAIHVATAAAKALAMYYITHRGDEFDKKEAIKITVVAMGLSLIPFVGHLGTVGQFVPLATKLLASASSFALADLAKSAIGMVDEIVPIVLMLLKSRKDAKA